MLVILATPLIRVGLF